MKRLIETIKNRLRKKPLLANPVVMPRFDWRNIEDGLPEPKEDDQIMSDEVMVEGVCSWDNSTFREPAYVYGLVNSPFRRFLTKSGFEYTAGVKIKKWAVIPKNKV